jgi:hypothetical protein
MLSSSLFRAVGRTGLKARFATVQETVQKSAIESYNNFRTAYLGQQKKLNEKL